MLEPATDLLGQKSVDVANTESRRFEGCALGDRRLGDPGSTVTCLTHAICHQPIHCGVSLD